MMGGEALLSDAGVVTALLAQIRRAAQRLSGPLTLMEVCGTHTHAIGAAGLRRLLPDSIRLVSGPGCPVCVTPVGYLDHAEALARRPGTLVGTFGDLYRVPSSCGSLERAASGGARVRILYSPQDAVALAADQSDRTVVFLSIGFETTTPTIAAALAQAEAEGTANFLVLAGNKLVPPALRALAEDEDVRLSGLLLPGHVSVITGWACYEFLARDYRLPAVVTGFSPADILRAVLALVRMNVAGEPRVLNHYQRVVTREGNRRAAEMVARFFEPCDATWRGLGTIPGSGLRLQSRWAHRDAARFAVDLPAPLEPAGCRCGDVLRGVIDPPRCPLFGRRCTPDAPVGACMVSSEGSCAAYYRHERLSEGGACDPAG